MPTLTRHVALTILLSGLSLNAIAAEKPDCDYPSLLQILRADNTAAFDDFRKQCSSVKDPRGLTIYDRARLAGSKNISTALSKTAQYNPQNYSKAMGKLLQTGLRFLGFDAGLIDGHLGERGIDAIKRYQKQYGFTPDGKLHEEWLADFYRRLVKKTQKKLTDLGFDAGSADGIIGPNTVTAMQAFRQERQMPQTDYREIDDQMLYQLMMMEHEQHKKELAKRDAERTARRAAQEAARRKELARIREAKRRRLVEQRKAAEAIEAAAKAQRQAQEQRSRQLAQAAQQEQAKREAARQAQSTLQRAFEQKARAEQARRAEQERQAAEQARIARERAAAERAAAEQKAREAAAKRAAAAAKAAEEKAQREADESARAAERADKEAIRAFQSVRRNRPIQLSDDIRRATNVTTTGNAKPAGRGFNEIKGRLVFSSRNACTVAGQSIGANWCESYYPSGQGKQCTVIMSSTGIVVSFLCE